MGQHVRAMADAATRSAPAIYFDGVTSARHAVTVTCTPSGLAVCDHHGDPVAAWPYSRLLHLNAPAHLFRLGLRDSDRLARLEIEDQALARTIERACPSIDRSDATARARRLSVMILSLGAIASLLLVAFFGLPQIADRLSRAVPLAIDQSLGRTGDIRFRATFDSAPDGQPFECGGGPGEAEGKATFDALIGKIAKAGGLEMPIHAAVIRRPEANAFALAGGHIYVLQGLIEQAKDVDEVAAIIAHELGHVANRDGIRSLFQNAGLSLIFGMVLGDFVGGAAIVGAAQLLIKAAYSRGQEAAADDFAVRTLQELNANPRALATFLDRVARQRDGMTIFLGHPSVADRIARINATVPVRQSSEPLLSAGEWQALRRICAPSS